MDNREDFLKADISFLNVTEEVINQKINELFPNFSYRENQREIIEYLVYLLFNKQEKYLILSSPVGSGKSLIAVHVSLIYNAILRDCELPRGSLIITKTIQLQNQYLKDFERSCGMKSLMGGTNYSCHTNISVPIPNHMKSHPTCRYEKSTGECEYDKAKQKFFSSPLKLLNYAFWIGSLNVESYRDCSSNLLICDEGHNLEQTILDKCESIMNLTNFANFDFIKNWDDNVLDSDGKIRVISYKLDSLIPNWEELNKLSRENLESLFIHCKFVLAALNKELDFIKSELETMYAEGGLGENIIKILEQELKPLQNLVDSYDSKVSILKLVLKDNIDFWHIEKIIPDEKEKVKSVSFSIKPLIISEVIRNKMLSLPKKVIIMSATADRVKESLKLKDSETILLEVPYVFPLENRKVYAYTSTPSLNYKTFSTVYPKYVKLADDIISEYDKDSIILIHSVSYKNAKEFKYLSSHKKRVRIIEPGEARNIERIINKGMIVISPSVTEGVNLPMVNVQIFIKVPFPFLGDPYIQKKMEIDEGWYSYEAMLSIIQGSGRAIRSEKDKADTYILDSSFLRVVAQNKGYIPSWFTETINYIT